MTVQCLRVHLCKSDRRIAAKTLSTLTEISNADFFFFFPGVAVAEEVEHIIG